MPHLRLSQSRRADLLRALQSHFHDQHSQEIGELKGSLLIDFFLEVLGPPVYNQAIGDARKFIQERLDDLENEVVDLSGGIFEGD